MLRRIRVRRARQGAHFKELVVSCAAGDTNQEKINATRGRNGFWASARSSPVAWRCAVRLALSHAARSEECLTTSKRTSCTSCIYFLPRGLSFLMNALTMKSAKMSFLIYAVVYVHSNFRRLYIRNAALQYVPCSAKNFSASLIRIMWHIITFS